MMKHLATIDPRRVPLFAAAAVVLVAAASISYVLLPQLKEHRVAAGDRVMLEETVRAAAALSAERVRLQEEVSQLELAKADDLGGLPQQALESFVIGRLHDVAGRSAIELESVEPSPGTEIGGVHEILFAVVLTGEYSNLHAWLRDLRGELGTVVVRELVLSPMDETAAPRLRAAALVAAYRSLE